MRGFVHIERAIYDLGVNELVAVIEGCVGNHG